MGDCGSCRYAELGVNEDGPMVECRRYPPQLAALGGDELTQAWPQMQRHDWCGEHDPTAVAHWIKNSLH